MWQKVVEEVKHQERVGKEYTRYRKGVVQKETASHVPDVANAMDATVRKAPVQHG